MHLKHAAIEGGTDDGAKEAVMRVKEIMTTRVWSCSEGASLGSAANTMLDHDCGFAPIVGNEGEVLGVITDRDICIAVARDDRNARDILALAVCSRRVVSCSPDDDIHDTLGRMETARVHRLVVVDEKGHLRGVISMTDILRHTVPGQTPDRECLTCAEAVGSLNLIGAVRRPRKSWVVAAE
jgi:CBS domain-containing protein